MAKPKGSLFNQGNSWMSSYDACEGVAREIMEKISYRNQQQKNSIPYSQANVQARQLIKKFTEDREKLFESLSASGDILTEREFERRERLLDVLLSKKLQIETAFNDREQGASRNALFGAEFGNRPTNSWGVEETEDTRDLTVEELKLQQQMAIKEQDKGLDTLYSVVVRQKHMAQNIGEELDLHNEIIDDIVDHSDRTRDRLLKETRHVGIVDRKSNTCGYWVAIIFLLITIIVVASVPFLSIV